MSRLLFGFFDDTPPPEAFPANRYARMMIALLPPGRLWRLIGDSVLSRLISACGDELGRLDLRVKDLIDEADPSTTDELLPEWEGELDLDSTGTTTERQARVLAATLAQPGFRPVDIVAALSPLLGTVANSPVVIERTHAQASAMGDDREIYRFFVYRNPAWGGTYQIAAAQALLDTISHSHTAGQVIESVNFLCDDAYSLCDRDLLGV